MTGRLAGKVAIVSGGARGMGASHVRALVDEGAKVVFGDILDAEGEAVAKDVGSATRYVHLDVTQPDDWEHVVATAVDAFGGVDILVNNAGIINVGLIEEYELSEWHRILDINLTGVFLGIRAVVGPMKAAGRGSIINISSIEGMAGTIACHGCTATKFAVRGLTKSTALELGPSGIRVNSIHPGLIKTPMTEWVPDDIFQTALGRAAEPEKSPAWSSTWPATSPATRLVRSSSSTAGARQAWVTRTSPRLRPSSSPSGSRKTRLLEIGCQRVG
jgi:3alpha(or 20beta)-hydroxysteroid dehydrogenase